MADELKVSVKDMHTLYEIFTQNDWFSKSGQDQAFKSFMDILVNFSDDEKDLILELASRYLWIGYKEYYEAILALLKSVEDKKIVACQKIIVFPIVKPKDIGKVKSSMPFLYMFKSVNFAGARYADIRFQVVDSYAQLKKIKFGSRDLLFLVDDFIGSGETLSTTIDEVLKNDTIKPSVINVLTLVAQSEILSRLNELSISYYSGYIRTKGISSFYTSPELESKISIMKSIEKYLPKVGEYSFGYNQSEALVSMHRTPNNTFPIFWMNYRKRGKVYKAPFLR